VSIIKSLTCQANCRIFLADLNKTVGSESQHYKKEKGKNKDIYFLRTIENITLNTAGAQDEKDNSPNEPNEQIAKSLITELQRSLEFYQTQTGAQAPTKILLDPKFKKLPDIASYLSSNLTIKTEILDVNQVIKSKTPLDEKLQMRCLPAIGSALTNIQNKKASK